AMLRPARGYARWPAPCAGISICCRPWESWLPRLRLPADHRSAPADHADNPDRADRADHPDRADRAAPPDRADSPDPPAPAGPPPPPDPSAPPPPADRADHPPRAGRAGHPAPADHPDPAAPADHPDPPPFSPRTCGCGRQKATLATTTTRSLSRSGRFRGSA